MSATPIISRPSATSTNASSAPSMRRKSASRARSAMSAPSAPSPRMEPRASRSWSTDRRAERQQADAPSAGRSAFEAAQLAHRRAVVAQLGDRIAHVAQRGMPCFLAYAGVDLRRPAPGQLLDRADIEVAVVEVLLQARHLPVQETTVLADRIAAHRRLARRHPVREELDGLRLGLRHRHLAVEHAMPEPGLAVLGAVPLVHRFQP